MLSTVNAGMLDGIAALPVLVEVDVTRGLPGFELVGLAETAVRESRLRVRAALESNGFRLPNRRLLVNLAPADKKKGGSALDLGIAVAVLAATGSCAPNRLGETLVLGELSLGGELRPVRGALAQLRGAKERGLKVAIVPAANEAEAALATQMDVRVANTLTEVLDHLNGGTALPAPVLPANSEPARLLELGDVLGQQMGARALMIAAAGKHHLLMLGPPGSGKTMLARRLPGLLPPLSEQERLDVATIRGAMGLPTANCDRRPFRAPHHSASAAALIGGGDPVRAGEATLAHHGVLFLDELPEFRRDATEALRISMSAGEVVIARVHGHVTLPANPQVVGAMNPCPCGYLGDSKRACRCSPSTVRRYHDRLSGPLLDRFDLQIRVPRLSPGEVRESPPTITSTDAQARVVNAQTRRFDRGEPLSIQASALRLLDQEADLRAMSMRAYEKTRAVAETIADLDGDTRVGEAHITEAMQFRQLDLDNEYM